VLGLRGAYLIDGESHSEHVFTHVTVRLMSKIIYFWRFVSYSEMTINYRSNKAIYSQESRAESGVISNSTSVLSV
jgi:hypothetical protein